MASSTFEATANVSVIIPAWNRADSVRTAIQSALRQSLPPLEVLVCDDGSDDATEEVVASIGDPRVVWCPGPHAGCPAVPRNRGLQKSKGEWIAFLDSDDEWTQEKLEKQLKQAVKSRCQAVSSDAYRVVPGAQTLRRMVNWTKERLSFHDILATNRIVCSTAIVHRSLLNSVRGFPENMELRAIGEDWAFWLRVAVFTDFAFVAEPLALYKDDAAHSVRYRGPGPFDTRKAVRDDFVAWCQRQGVDRIYSEKATSHLRIPGSIVSYLANRLKGLRLA